MAIWDYIIIGGGSAGCVVANRLSANPATRVLLLESGGSHRNPLVTIPGGELMAIQSKTLNWGFVAEPDATLGGRRDPWPRGRVLGGSSSINGMMWVRGAAADYDRWAALGNPGWSWQDLLPLYRRMETFEHGEDAYHGAHGPLAISGVRKPHPLTRAFIAAAVERGMPYNPDPNGASCEGVGPVHANIRRGRRITAASAYLDPIRRRPNLQIQLGATVDTIGIANGRAVAVHYRRGGKTHSAEVGGEVILCAGAVMSPVILQRSGIGPAALLARHGIPLQAELAGVGENLQEHPALWCSAYVDLPTYNVELGPLKTPLHALNWLLFGEGPAAKPIAQALAFARSQPGQSPDIQLCFVPAGYTIEADGKVKLLDRPAVTLPTYVCRPHARGSIVLRSREAADHPLIHPNLLGDARDRAVLTQSLRIAHSLFTADAFRPHFRGLGTPTAHELRDAAALDDYVTRNTSAAYHPVGTCKMGRDPLAVVDPRLRVHGVQGLRVADASIMPTITSGNTNAPAFLVGEKAADLILQDQRAL